LRHFCNNLICGSGSSALKQKNISIMETAQKVQKIRLPPPRHLAGINKIFAIQFCFARNIPFRPFRIFPIAFNKKVLIQADF
jgi:hypothetical protein